MWNLLNNLEVHDWVGWQVEHLHLVWVIGKFVSPFQFVSKWKFEMAKDAMMQTWKQKVEKKSSYFSLPVWGCYTLDTIWCRVGLIFTDLSGKRGWIRRTRWTRGQNKEIASKTCKDSHPTTTLKREAFGIEKSKPILLLLKPIALTDRSTDPIESPQRKIGLHY